MEGEMKKIFFILFIFISVFVYAKEVPSSNQGIANASPGDYIFRSSGEKVVLSQIDIDFARRQLGLTSTQNTQNRVSSSNNSTSSESSTDSNNILIVLFLIVVGIIIVIGVCVSNITTTVAKNSGMDDESAKKVGKSAGVLAGTAAAIGAAILLGKAGGTSSNPNNITITHKRG
jgi:hypothetical protein